MKPRYVLYGKSDGIAWITINRPEKMNALTPEMFVDLADAVEKADLDENVGVIVITGAGEKAFSSGGDVDEFVKIRTDYDKSRRLVRNAMNLFSTIRNAGKPVIATVNGICVGGGLEINLACDLCVATEDSQFGFVGPRVGSVPAIGGTQTLPRIVGERRAKYQLFTTKFWDAREAEKIGLVNEVVPKGKLKDAALKLAKRIMEHSPTALMLAKLSLNSEGDMLGSSYHHGREMVPFYWLTEEAEEGMKAFLEKRKPRFRMR